MEDIQSQLSNHTASTVIGRRVLLDVRQGLASFDNWMDLNKIRAQWPTVPDKSFLEGLIIHNFLDQ